jgi:hypothetical protein
MLLAVCVLIALPLRAQNIDLTPTISSLVAPLNSGCSFARLPEQRFAKSNASKDLTYYSTGAHPDCAHDAGFPLLELRKQA